MEGLGGVQVGEDCHHFRVRPKEEGEGRGDVGAVDGALVEFDAFSEEDVRALEPEVVQAVFEGAEDGETIAACDGSERKLAMHGGGGRRCGPYVVCGGGHVFVELGFGLVGLLSAQRETMLQSKSMLCDGMNLAVKVGSLSTPR